MDTAVESQAQSQHHLPGAVGAVLEPAPATFTVRKGVNAKKAAKLIPAMTELAKSGLGGSAEALLQTAADPTSPAHECFEWDDSIAGNGYRLWQARNYWGAIRIEIQDTKGDTHKAPAFIPIVIGTEDGDDRGYRDVRDVVRNENWNAQMLEQAKRELKGFKNRYAMLRGVSELGGLFDFLDKLYPE